MEEAQNIKHQFLYYINLYIIYIYIYKFYICFVIFDEVYYF